ncbi:MAG: hypothetical protein A2233_03920 [Candidatus Kerfeldbacteria bacterium RIFOXYA2_FULL_38_24]|uniref:CYTH domain-containing protein n=1 Tax=Candidatus Kerfeldbacteria bacterium RIFOXYB2_FULL_38_14 TaxID=1798547 RepID=A0A1G2BDI8_9BACT|nr:MAG: hypothetical protein A2233_03920 [Candidatus Kerfeldbacteria bacterium RIFOXYA2_FULL_38_24]OGY87214.1 MAG: hypothetical protein A2319_01040 [Candidatus Kerfeldbacteria bacterium RIFOXYB2_FULL_38_14]OGY88480.1 MAG: hypothetical protein A2458_01750 [Candidatus Kerfeldbacteria bacterium RIFOXYC2_FULL_38_9]
MKTEIEIKYTVDFQAIPKNILRVAKKMEISQGYISVANPEERVRKSKTGEEIKYTYTTKCDVRTDGLVRQEKEKEIDEAGFQKLWPQTKGRRIAKTRYNIPYQYIDVQTKKSKNVMIELDQYHKNSHLAGLLVAEVEFDSTELVKRFIAPTWFRKNVTADKNFKNKNLAIMNKERAKILIDSSK